MSAVLRANLYRLADDLPPELLQEPGTPWHSLAAAAAPVTAAAAPGFDPARQRRATRVRAHFGCMPHIPAGMGLLTSAIESYMLFYPGEYVVAWPGCFGYAPAGPAASQAGRHR